MGKKLMKSAESEISGDVFQVGNLLPEGDAETVIPEAAVKIQLIDGQVSQLSIFGAKLVWQKGQILDEVKTRFARPGLLRLCGQIGMHETTANNYIREYKYKDSDFVKEIGHNRTLRLLPILDDPRARLERDKLFYTTEDGGEIEFAVGDVQNMTEEQLRALVKEIKNRDKDVKSAEERAMRVEKKLDDERAENDKLRKENAELKGQEELPPEEKLVCALDEYIRAAIRTLDKLQDAKISEAQEERVKSALQLIFSVYGKLREAFKD